MTLPASLLVRRDGRIREVWRRLGWSVSVGPRLGRLTRPPKNAHD